MKYWLVTSALLICGCASQFASTGEHVYQKAKNGPLIALPSHSNSEDPSHYYDLPSQTQHARVRVEPPED